MGFILFRKKEKDTKRPLKLREQRGANSTNSLAFFDIVTVGRLLRFRQTYEVNIFVFYNSQLSH